MSSVIKGLLLVIIFIILYKLNKLFIKEDKETFNSKEVFEFGE